MNTPSERAGWSREALVEAIRRELTDDTIDTVSLTRCGKPDVLLAGCKAVGYTDPADAADKFAGFVADAIMALAPPSSVDGGRVTHLERGIAEIMAGLVSGKISGEDIVWASEIETLWERCHAILDPDHSCELPQTDNADAIIAALAAALLPVGNQGVSSSRDLGSDAGSALDRPCEGCGVETLELHKPECPELAKWLRPPVQQTDSDKSREEPPFPPIADGEPETP